MIIHKKSQLIKDVTAFLTIFLIASCTNTTNKEQLIRANNPVPPKFTLKFGEKVTFDNYEDKYFTGTNIYYSNNTIYIKIEGDLPYDWTRDSYANIIVYYNADDYKTFDGRLSGFLDANKNEIDRIKAGNEDTFYLFFNINDYPHMEAERSGIIINFGVYTQDNSQYESYDISRHLLEYNFD